VWATPVSRSLISIVMLLTFVACHKAAPPPELSPRNDLEAALVLKGIEMHRPSTKGEVLCATARLGTRAHPAYADLNPAVVVAARYRAGKSTKLYSYSECLKDFKGKFSFEERNAALLIVGDINIENTRATGSVEVRFDTFAYGALFKIQRENSRWTIGQSLEGWET
jgi:hypothetical protein